MSRAFTKDGQENEALSVLPDRPVSTERNLVTARGRRLIDAALADARSSHATAQAAGDRHGMAQAARDITYWSKRRASAELSEPEPGSDVVRFGMVVSLETARGDERRWRIVGEDEADPVEGRISHVSPLAKALFGRGVGDEVAAGPGKAEIIAISSAPED